MKGLPLSLGLVVTSVSRGDLPANLDSMVRVYVGDQQYGLLRDPQSRGLYLLSPTGCFFLDGQQLVATFSDAVRQWDWERGFSAVRPERPVDDGAAEHHRRNGTRGDGDPGGERERPGAGAAVERLGRTAAVDHRRRRRRASVRAGKAA